MATINNIGSSIPIQVTFGATQDSSFTAYAPICGGTTSTGSFQSTTSGSSGQVMVSNGSSSLPGWTSAPSGNMILLNTQTITSPTTTVTLTSSGIVTYRTLLITANNVIGSVGINPLWLQYNYGAGAITTGYYGGVTYFATNSTTLNNVSVSPSNPISGLPVMASTCGPLVSVGSSANIWWYQPVSSGPALGASIGTMSGTSCFQDTLGNTYFGTFTGVVPLADTAPATQFVFTMPTGFINTGIFSVYGIKE